MVRIISAKKNEPQWMLDFRLKAYKKWQTMKAPNWAELDYPEINYNDIVFYSAPKKKKKLNSLDEVDPELLKTFEKQQRESGNYEKLTNVAVDVVFDSVSIATTFKDELSKIRCYFLPNFGSNA